MVHKNMENTSPGSLSSSFSIQKADVDTFRGMILPPHSATLSVGGDKKSVIPDETKTKPKIASVLQLHLCCDHRIYDHDTAAKVLESISRYISNPDMLL